MEKILNYINGELIAPFSENYIDNFNPAIGEVYSLIPDSNEKDVELAVDVASRAFEEWSQTPAEERSRVMLRIADLIDRDHERLAKAESVDNGKTVKQARQVDIPRASANFRFFATAILHDKDEAFSTDIPSALNYTQRKPVGVVGCISPWNLPLYLFTWKIAPAIASGCAVIAKPSEITPMTAFLLSELCIEAGLPKGVLNIIHGTGPNVGAAITAHPKIKAISFTGGTSTGAEISRVAAPMFKKLSLELGGKNPNIIFADCDLDKAIKTTIRSSFSNQGEICLCGSRIFIERTIYDKFKSRFVAEINSLKVGDPDDDENFMGAVVSKAHMEKVLYYIELAKAEGGTILSGGNQIHPEGRCKNGYFIEPTVIEGLPFDCRTNQEEIFGPVVTLVPFDNEEEVLKFANSTQYGLAATVWTENLSRAHRVASALDMGIVWINCWLLRDLRTPFGGVKQSGVGREGGFHALHFFTEEKNICIRIGN